MEELEKLKQELANMKKMHIGIWDMYGSELCVGDMIRQEKALEDKIKELENNGKTK